MNSQKALKKLNNNVLRIARNLRELLDVIEVNKVIEVQKNEDSKTPDIIVRVPEDSNDLISISEVCKIAGYKISSVNTFITKNQIPYIRKQNEFLFDRKEIELWIKEHPFGGKNRKKNPFGVKKSVIEMPAVNLPSKESTDYLITAKEASILTGLSNISIYRMSRVGILHSTRQYGSVLFSNNAIKKWMRDNAWIVERQKRKNELKNK